MLTKAANAAFASSQLMRFVMLFIVILSLLSVSGHNTPNEKRM
jgi:hypothetical protein